MVVGRPLQELELAHQHGPEPLALGHLRLREALPPPPAPRLGQVDEGAHIRPKRLELLEQLPANRRREAVARARDVDQVVALVVPEDEGVEAAAVSMGNTLRSSSSRRTSSGSRARSRPASTITSKT